MSTGIPAGAGTNPGGRGHPPCMALLPLRHAYLLKLHENHYANHDQLHLFIIMLTNYLHILYLCIACQSDSNATQSITS